MSLFKTKREKLSLHDPSKIDRLPPHDLAAEQGLLGCVMLSPNDVLTEFMNGGGEVEWFYDLKNQDVIKAMLRLYEAKKPVDLISVSNLIKAGDWKGQEVIPYVSSLPDCVPSAANFAYYAEIIYDKFLLRKMIQVGTNLVASAYDPSGSADDLLEDFEKTALSVRSKKDQAGLVDVGLTLRNLVTKIKKVQSSKQSIGLSTGLRELDKISGGLENGQLWIISGEESAGKTSLAFEIAMHRVFNHGEKVGLFPMETVAQTVFMRMICNRMAIDSRKLRSNPEDAEITNLEKGADQFDKLKHRFLICESSHMTPERIKARARRMAQDGATMFVIDYLQLVATADKKKSAHERVSDAVLAIQDLAKELDRPIILLSSLNEAGEVRLSGEIKYAASVMLKLKKPKGDDQEAKQVWRVLVKIEKGKDFGTGKFTLKFHRNIFRFENESVGEEYAEMI